MCVGTHVIISHKDRKAARSLLLTMAPAAALSVPIFSILSHFVILDGDLLCETPHISSHGRVPVVFNSVVGSSGQKLRDFCPFVTQPLLGLVNYLLFLLAPRFFFDCRVKMV